MKKFYPLFVFTFLYSISFCQISITTTGTAFTQDFNTLVSTGTSSTLPVGWAFLETGTSANTTYGADNGAANSGNTYSYGTTGAVDRAFGGLQSGNLTPIVGASFVNNTGTLITSLVISYTGEQWRLGTANRVDRLEFSLSTNATSITSGTYTPLTALNFIAPTTTGVVGLLDGNATANSTLINATINGLNIAVGSTFWIRWADFNATGADDGLAIDNFSISANGSTPLPPCAEPTAQPTNLSLTATSNSVAGSFSTIPSPTTVENYLVVRSLTSPLTQLPQDGTNYTVGQPINAGNGTVIALSNDGTFTDNNTAPSTQYFYFVFSLQDQFCSGAPNYYLVNPLTLDITTPALIACSTPAEPTLLSNPLSTSNTAISGSFTGSGASKYLVVRCTTTPLTTAPANTTIYTAGQTLGNGVVVSYNSSNTFSATGLTPATLYYFFIYAANENCTGAPVYSSISLSGNQTTTNNANNIPPGYYATVNTQTCSALKTVLFDIIKPTVANPAPTYAGICTMYPSTDFKVSDFSSNNVIWDMYSDNPTGPDPYEFEYQIDVDGCGGSGANNPPIPGSAEGILYNREHSFPQAWFGGSVEPMYSDAMHIFPTDKEVNNKRSSFPYGKVSTPTFTSLNGGKLGANTTAGYTGVVFEPINEYKGDFARSHFYMITAYQDKVAAWQANKPEIFNGNAYTAFDDWYLLLMYQWHIADPVSPKEISRNDAVYLIQGNRNPYIDNPQYVNAVFQCASALPVLITTFIAKNIDNKVELYWKVTNEHSFKKYVIERSIDGRIFNAIGEVESRNVPTYNFDDNKLPKYATLYYRLKLQDVNGTFTYSKIIIVNITKNDTDVNIYPNPVIDNLSVEFKETLTVQNLLLITDVTGRILKQQIVPAFSKKINIAVNNLTKGTYILEMESGNKIFHKSFLVL